LSLRTAHASREGDAGCCAGGLAPSRVVLKIRCRSRRTIASWARQSTLSQLRPWPSGPFAAGSTAAHAMEKLYPVIVSNLPFGSQPVGAGFKGSPASRQRPYRAGHQARYPASYTQHWGRSRYAALRFPVAFGNRHSLLGASCPARGFRPPYGRPTAAPNGDTDPREVSTFRIARDLAGRRGCHGRTVGAARNGVSPRYGVVRGRPPRTLRSRRFRPQLSGPIPSQLCASGFGLLGGIMTRCTMPTPSG
jgi:hypothetical protein